jgi:hypothetical protein
MPALPFPTTEAVTRADQAHREAMQMKAAAEAQLRTLQDTIADGGDVEPSALTEAKARIEHASLRVEAKQRQLAQARYTARREALEAISREIHEFDSASGTQQLLNDLAAIETAVNAFIAHGAAYDARVADWVSRSATLGAERDLRGFIPGPDQGHVAANPHGPHTRGSVQAKNIVLRRLDVPHVLDSLRNELHFTQQRPDRVDLATWGHNLVKFLRDSVQPSTPTAHESVQAAHFRDS